MTRLEEIKKRAEQATNYCNDVEFDLELSKGYAVTVAKNPPVSPWTYREDIPYLLQLVERMRECLKDYSEADDVAQLDGNCGIGGECQENANRLLAELDQPAKPTD